MNHVIWVIFDCVNTSCSTIAADFAADTKCEKEISINTRVRNPLKSQHNDKQVKRHWSRTAKVNATFLEFKLTVRPFHLIFLSSIIL